MALLGEPTNEKKTGLINIFHNKTQLVSVGYSSVSH